MIPVHFSHVLPQVQLFEHGSSCKRLLSFPWQGAMGLSGLLLGTPIHCPLRTWGAVTVSPMRTLSPELGRAWPPAACRLTGKASKPVLI